MKPDEYSATVHVTIAILYGVILTLAILGGYLVVAGAAGALVVAKLVTAVSVSVQNKKKEVK